MSHGSPLAPWPAPLPSAYPDVGAPEPHLASVSRALIGRLILSRSFFKVIKELYL